MELIKVNHVITAVRDMLDTMVDQTILDVDTAKVLLPLLVLHAIRNDSIDIGGE